MNCSKADPGRTILYSLIVGLPTAVIAGWIFESMLREKSRWRCGIGAQLAKKSATGTMPGFALTLLTILAPILLMMLATVVDVVLPAHQEKFAVRIVSVPIQKGTNVVRVIREINPALSVPEAQRFLEASVPPLLGNVSRSDADSARKRLQDAGAVVKVQGNRLREWSGFLGHPTVAMLLGVLFAFYSFGSARGFDKQQLSKFSEECLAPVALVLLVVGAGGGFSRVLMQRSESGHGGIGKGSRPLCFWLVAALIRIATGSATVAISTPPGSWRPWSPARPPPTRSC